MGKLHAKYAPKPASANTSSASGKTVAAKPKSASGSKFEPKPASAKAKMVVVPKSGNKTTVMDFHEEFLVGTRTCTFMHTLVQVCTHTPHTYTHTHKYIHAHTPKH